MNETLVYLAMGYFHQDYDLMADEPLGVIRAFLAAEAPETVRSLRNEICGLLAGPATDADLHRVWYVDGRSSYEPEGDGMSIRQWLQAVAEILDEAGSVASDDDECR